MEKKRDPRELAQLPATSRRQQVCLIPLRQSLPSLTPAHEPTQQVDGQGEPLARSRTPARCSAPSFPQQIVRTTKNPVFKGGSIAVLRGNLAPEGAIIKQAAMDPGLARHEGRAVVFESLEDLANRIDDPKLDVTAKDILVCKNAGPKGAPGMPESGYLPIPKKLAQAGVKDMVRISDARMSGTAFGSIVLHVTPESALGGPLALVKNGDRILLDVPKRRLELKVSAGELAKRRKAWRKPAAKPEEKRGYRKLFMEQVTQADKGCDFEFCMPGMTARVPRAKT